MGSLALLVGLLALSTRSDPDGQDGPTATTVGSTVPAAPGWQIVSLDGRPSAADRSGTDAIAVVDDELGLLQLVDVTTLEVTSTAIGGAPVAVSAGVEGEIWAADAGGVVSTSVGGVSRSFDVGGTLVDVVADGDGAWVADLETSRVVHVTRSGVVDADHAVPDGVVRLALGGGRLWVTGRDHTVTPVDLAAGQVLSPVSVGNGPIGVVVTTDAVWVANGDDGTVSRLDPATGARLGPDVRVGGGPVALAALGDSVWVLAQDAGRIVRIDVGTARVVREVQIPTEMSRARDLAVTPLGVWVVGVDRAMLAHLPGDDPWVTGR